MRKLIRYSTLSLSILNDIQAKQFTLRKAEQQQQVLSKKIWYVICMQQIFFNLKITKFHCLKFWVVPIVQIMRKVVEKSGIIYYADIKSTRHKIFCNKKDMIFPEIKPCGAQQL
jgi:hypothetical protein